MRDFHGMTKTKFYETWANMIARCTNSKLHTFKHYGGRGIKVCKRWKRFKNFMDDMYIAYLFHVKEYGQKETEIDRINNNEGYTIKNCKWATHAEQRLNQRTNRLITYQGKTQPVKAWAIELGLNYQVIRSRIWRDKLSPEIAFRKEKAPRRNNVSISYKGKIQSLTQWAKELNMSIQTLHWRIKHWDTERALNEPI